MSLRVRRTALSALACIVVASASFAIARLAESGPTPPQAPRAQVREHLSPSLPMQVAGSGSNLPLTRILLAAWAQREQQTFTLHASIGTTGAIQALRGGAIHIGLLSRTLKEQERAQEPAIQVIHYARSVVVLAAHPDTVDRSIAPAEFFAVLRGERTTWSNGVPRTFLLRERGDSSQAAVAASIPEFARLEREAQTTRRFRVLYSDADLRQALMATPGAMGWTDLGALGLERSPLVVVDLDYIPASGERTSPQSYRFSKPLDFAVVQPVDPRAASFMRWCRSPEGRALIQSSGFVAAGATE